MARIIIIGASAAGHTAAVALRGKNQDCPLTLITEEPYPFYDRRKLPEFLAGKIKEKEVFLCGEDFYQEKAITFLKESKVTGLNLSKGCVYLKDKAALEFDFLIIASGRRALLPEIPGIGKSGVFGLNSLEDFRGFAARLVNEPVCLIGSNEFALNIAGIIASKGREVKLISNDGFPGGSSVSEGIEVINSEVVEIIGEGQTQAIRLKEGKIIGTSLVVFLDKDRGNTDFLKNTGVDLKDTAVLVDSGMRTSIANIFSSGSVCLRRDLQSTQKGWEEVLLESQYLTDVLIKEIR